MSAQGLEVIDHTVQTTHEWINELAARLGYGSKRSALRLLRVTLHMVRDQLSVDELAQFSAQLPLLIRGMTFEGWNPQSTRQRSPSFDETIEAAMQGDVEFSGAGDVKHVFDLLNNRISRGEVEDIRACLAKDARTHWAAP